MARGPGVIPTAQQTAWELDRVLALVEELQPNRILEVGVYEGGTLWYWLRSCGYVVAIDDTMRPPGPDTWTGWADEEQAALLLLHGSSFDAATIESARIHGPYGMAFIDADHRYESVRADWENYSPMVEQGGIVCLHDILPRPDYGVDRLWAEIKAEPGRRTLEIVEAGNAAPCGIGVVWM